MVQADRCSNLDIPLDTPNHGGGTAGGRGAKGDRWTGRVRVYLKAGPNSYLRLNGE
jgi:hypothetical protein